MYIYEYGIYSKENGGFVDLMTHATLFSQEDYERMISECESEIDLKKYKKVGQRISKLKKKMEFKFGFKDQSYKSLVSFNKQELVDTDYGHSIVRDNV